MERQADPHPALQASPLEVRRELAGVANEVGVSALLMEDSQARPDEDNFDLSRRIVDEADIRTFVLFWPVGARLHGLEVEIGHLLTRMDDGDLDPADVYLLAEKRNLGVDTKEGTVAWSEPGNRTRYVARGCPVRRWESRRSLWAQMGSVCVEHEQRHG